MRALTPSEARVLTYLLLAEAGQMEGKPEKAQRPADL